MVRSFVTVFCALHQHICCSSLWPSDVGAVEIVAAVPASNATVACMMCNVRVLDKDNVGQLQNRVQLQNVMQYAAWSSDAGAVEAVAAVPASNAVAACPMCD
jgi:hypothetical protein